MIDSAAAVADLAERARARGRVAIDTEFVWERTYYPRLGVVQIGLDQEDCHLIDASKSDVVAPLGPVLADPAVELILHDAPQDLTILRRATGAFPLNVFDTRTAAGFAGMSSVLSLKDLVAHQLDVTLDNDSTRTDWLARPLSDRQIAYALDDVRYLPAMRDRILEQIRVRERECWLREEMEVLNEADLYRERDPMEQYSRIKGTGRLSARELAILRELTAWREVESRTVDRPRSFTLPDKILLAIARRKPDSEAVLQSVNDLSERKLKRYARDLLEAVGRGLSTPAADCPTPAVRIDKRRLRVQLSKAVAFAKKRSEREDLDPPFVATRSEIENLVMHGPGEKPQRHRLLRGWRRDLLGNELLAFAGARGTGA